MCVGGRLFLAPLVLLNYLLFNLLLFLEKKSGGAKAPPRPLPLRGPCMNSSVLNFVTNVIEKALQNTSLSTIEHVVLLFPKSTIFEYYHKRSGKCLFVFMRFHLNVPSVRKEFQN